MGSHNVNRPPASYEVHNSRYGRIVCYSNQSALAHAGNYNGWNNAGTVSDSLPVLVTQLFVANLTYRIFYHLGRPLFLPPFVAQILSGLLFSPTFLGKHDFVLNNIFPYRFTMVLETFANLALVYNMFILGLGTDLRMIIIKQVKPLIIALVGLLVALPAAVVFYYLPGNGNEDKIFKGCFYWAFAFGCTNFPELARILADLKLLRTDMGRTAMGAALVTDMCTWVFLIFCFACFSKSGVWNKAMAYSIVSTIIFVLLCIFVIRPGITWAFTNTIQGYHDRETHVLFTLGSIVLCALITDSIGV